jgi:hypothetical protein
MPDTQDLDETNKRLDAVAGSQIAMQNVLALLLASYRGNPQIVAALQEAMEFGKANLLASKSSDFKIDAYEEIMKSVIESLS